MVPVLPVLSHLLAPGTKGDDGPRWPQRPPTRPTCSPPSAQRPGPLVLVGGPSRALHMPPSHCSLQFCLWTAAPPPHPIFPSFSSSLAGFRDLTCPPPPRKMPHLPCVWAPPTCTADTDVARQGGLRRAGTVTLGQLQAWLGVGRVWTHWFLAGPRESCHGLRWLCPWSGPTLRWE